MKNFSYARSSLYGGSTARLEGLERVECKLARCDARERSHQLAELYVSEDGLPERLLGGQDGCMG